MSFLRRRRAMKCKAALATRQLAAVAVTAQRGWPAIEPKAYEDTGASAPTAKTAIASPLKGCRELCLLVVNEAHREE